MASPCARRLPALTVPARPQQLELFDFSVETALAYGLAVLPWCGLAAWHHELDRQSAIMRPRTPLYRRFEATARQLTRERIRGSRDVAAIARLVARLSAARYPTGDLHGLERVWSRANLGTLIVEATNRQTLLDLGRDTPRAKGPALDPRCLPDDRLDHLIQSHRNIEVVNALRAERERRARAATVLDSPYQE
jgi:hypothetical protein